MPTERKLTYGKETGFRDLETEKVFADIGDAEQGNKDLNVVNVPSAYQKTEGVFSYDIVCVISGGTERERTFLNELEKKRTFQRLEVIFVSTPKGEGGLTPKMMDSVYQKICVNGVLIAGNRRIQLEDVDMVYMFTDVDHYEEELRSILATQQDDEPAWIISNPDFEIWIYYCYRNNPHEELREVIEAIPSARSSLLKTINGRFNNGGGLDTRKAFEHLEDGIAHSKEHHSASDGIPNLLSTLMHVFAEDVLKRLGDEYHAFLQKKQEFRNKYTSSDKLL